MHPYLDVYRELYSALPSLIDFRGVCVCGFPTYFREPFQHARVVANKSRLATEKVQRSSIIVLIVSTGSSVLSSSINRSSCSSSSDARGTNTILNHRYHTGWWAVWDILSERTRMSGGSQQIIIHSVQADMRA